MSIAVRMPIASVGSLETEPCPTCATPARPITDGNGRVKLECPHCDLGWPKAKPMPEVRCAHGIPTTAHCEPCTRKRALHRNGIQAHAEYKARDPEAYTNERKSAAAKGWETRRAKTPRVVRYCTRCGRELPASFARKTCDRACADARVAFGRSAAARTVVT